MTSRLPPGVPESNERQDFSAYQQPAPSFDRPPDPARAPASDAASLFREPSAPADDDDQDRRRDERRRPPAVDRSDIAGMGGLGLSNQAILLLIGLIFVGLTAYLVMKNREPVPLCSEQPEWNQYNCRPG